jgi:hypothetical protein
VILDAAEGHDLRAEFLALRADRAVDLPLDLRRQQGQPIPRPPNQVDENSYLRPAHGRSPPAVIGAQIP